MEKDSELYRSAIIYATERHEGQERDGGERFIFHPLRVARTVRRIGYSSIVAAGAVLHDVPEETGTPIYVIRNFFGDDVAQIVDDLTQRTDEPNPEYRERLRHASRESKVVKIVDRLNNLNGMEGWNNFKILTYLSDTEILLSVLRVSCITFEDSILDKIKQIKERLSSNVRRSPVVESLIANRLHKKPGYTENPATVL